MTPELFEYPLLQNIEPSVGRLLRWTTLLPRFEIMPIQLARQYMEISSSLANPRSSRKLKETLLRPFTDAFISLRIWQDATWMGPRPIVLYIHGGGWTLGSSKSHRSVCELIATHVRCKLISVDYRRAPEHPYPGPITDLERIWHWLLEQIHLWGYHDQPVIIAGDSAGANLATVLCRRLRDQNKIMPDAQWLMYPVTDLSQETLSYQLYGQGLILTRSLMDWFIKQYRGDTPKEHQDLSPLLASDLTGLPPVFIGLAGCDVLLDEGRAYAKRLSEAGVPVTIRFFPKLIHGFINLLVIPEALSATYESIGCMQELIQSLRRI